MEFGVVLKIAAVGLLVAVVNSVLTRSGRDDYALLAALAGIAAALLMLLPQLGELLDEAERLLDF